MPIVYEIERYEEDRGLVRTTCTGSVDAGQVQHFFETLVDDPQRPEVLDVLLDLTGVENLPDRAQVRDAADTVGRTVALMGWGNLAVVAPSDVVFGVSRMFETLAEEYFDASTVVRSRREAEDWHLQARQVRR